MTTDRRTFLSQAAASMAAFTVAGNLEAQQQPAPAASVRALDPALLAALGETVLPESLGAAGRAKAVGEFREWIAAYVPVSEEMHGYGSAEITYTVSDPAPGWNAQLHGMDLLARKQSGAGFAALKPEKRDALVRAQLATIRTGRLPSNPLSAPHVAVALLAHWAASSAATDFAYGVKIGKDNCKLLADSPRKPLPLAPGGKS
ncbi:MAG TPA: hypothetical protein VGQ30_05870 [Gemmatimonadaceae bacterium]|jgi:hypothetical protein|nr:hypothetical protein [Gemmatimonadaceae bacterium]